MPTFLTTQHAGMLLEPVIFGTIAEASGWPGAVASLAVMSALGLLAGGLAKVR